MRWVFVCKNTLYVIKDKNTGETFEFSCGADVLKFFEGKDPGQYLGITYRVYPDGERVPISPWTRGASVIYGIEKFVVTTCRRTAWWKTRLANLRWKRIYSKVPDE